MKLLSKLFIVWFLGSILMVSCIGDDDDNFFQVAQVSKILDANVPDTMSLGETYTLEITYQKDSDCHEFSNFEAVNEGDSLYYVRAITIFTESPNCNQDPEEVVREVDFINRLRSDFTFRFLADRDSLGEFIYIDKDVIVVEENLNDE